jgi:LPPG:FO 2-phospho-L-lactate transferase
VLTGGVGGAKLALGLTSLLSGEQVTAIVNTGDDFVHLGLAVSPDIDTLLYTLSGKANAAQGWGREGESWNFMAALRTLGGEDWFQLGDGDLALHVMRTARLRAGHRLGAIIADFGRHWDITATILPMSDDPVRTIIATQDGDIDFQHYFVARRCEPAVRGIRFAGAAEARPGPGVLEAIGDAATEAILIAPSNPFLSVDPILAVPGIREALASAKAPVIAVSPLIGGQAVKGPTAKLMAELGLEVSAAAVARHYGTVLDGILVDERDPPAELGVASARADTMMRTLDDRMRVAQAALHLAVTLAR